MRLVQILRLIPKAFGEIKFTKLLFIVFAEGIQIAGVVGIGVLARRPWECVAILGGYIIGKAEFKSQIHAKSFFMCTVITWAIFYFISKGTPTFHMSYTLPCILGILFAAALHVIDNKFGGGNGS